MKEPLIYNLHAYAKNVVDDFLETTGTAQTAFGRDAFGDSNFYKRFSEGRVGVNTAQKAIDYCQKKLQQQSTNNQESQ